MKRFFCILLALFMALPCDFAQDMRTAPYETVILGRIGFGGWPQDDGFVRRGAHVRRKVTGKSHEKGQQNA